MRELRALDKFYQRFKIDDHLRRYDKALLNLSLAGMFSFLFLSGSEEELSHIGPERFEEALAYIEKHQLYDNALSIWKGTEQYDVSPCLLYRRSRST